MAIEKFLDRLNKGEFSGVRFELSPSEVLKAKEEELVQSQVEQANVKAEKEKILEELLEKAKASGAEAESYKALLAEKDQKLESLQKERVEIERQLLETELQAKLARFGSFQRNFLGLVVQRIAKDPSCPSLQEMINQVTDMKYKFLLADVGIVDSDGQVTKDADKILVMIAEQLRLLDTNDMNKLIHELSHAASNRGLRVKRNNPIRKSSDCNDNA